jgi:hypothetical protein
VSASRLQQIAHILQVSIPFLFEGAPPVAGQPKAADASPLPDYVSEFLATSDGLALMKAFTRLKDDPKLLRSTVNLVEEIADNKD